MLRTHQIAALIALTLPALALPAAAQEQRPRDHIYQCFKCHGDDGIAKDHEVPHLAGQQRDYLYNQLKAYRSGKRPNKEMRYMSREMTDQELREIADYFAALPPR